ncbi:MAG: zinc-ribbon domain-containing protein [Candidatus Lokiarchaeota archaeon]|nr:zinc-ribbon domain-containing protein [Candidatus Lokiarchaeota archaeon]
MYCSKCGKKTKSENARFCSYCGTPIREPENVTNRPESQTSTNSTYNENYKYWDDSQYDISDDDDDYEEEDEDWDQDYDDDDDD